MWVIFDPYDNMQRRFFLSYRTKLFQTILLILYSWKINSLNPENKQKQCKVNKISMEVALKLQWECCVGEVVVGKLQLMRWWGSCFSFFNFFPLFFLFPLILEFLKKPREKQQLNDAMNNGTSLYTQNKLFAGSSLPADKSITDGPTDGLTDRPMDGDTLL